MLNRLRQQQDIKLSKSFSSGVKFMETPNQRHTFGNFGPDESPERVENSIQKRELEKSVIMAELKRQIQRNNEARIKEKQDDDRYGRKLNMMTKEMLAKEQERHLKQKEMHYQLLTK